MNDPNLDEVYWNNRYLNNTAAWDMGRVSPPLQYIFDSLDDKHLALLIPGAGNAYEAGYLFEKGFTNIHIIDIAEEPIKQLRSLYGSNPHIHLYHGDFFTHQGSYDIIIEQTFFCALPPSMRSDYVKTMHRLLKPNGTLQGVLFDKMFEESPPFGGSAAEYRSLFSPYFDIEKLDACLLSIPKRMGTELIFRFRRKVG